MTPGTGFQQGPWSWDEKICDLNSTSREKYSECHLWPQTWFQPWTGNPHQPFLCVRHRKCGYLLHELRHVWLNAHRIVKWEILCNCVNDSSTHVPPLPNSRSVGVQVIHRVSTSPKNLIGNKNMGLLSPYFGLMMIQKHLFNLWLIWVIHSSE